MSNSQFGFKDGDLEEIIRSISSFPELTKAAIFGSRAKGSFQRGSDVDIVIWGTTKDLTWKIDNTLNEGTSLPYKFDVLDFNQINNLKLTEHSERAGVIIFDQQSKNKL